MRGEGSLLVTTSLKETWGHKNPILFLGEWCRPYGRETSQIERDFDVVPYHWSDRKKLDSDYQYLGEVYERGLTKLATHLNRTHGVNHSLRYWRILVGPWLAYFIHILFDRWECIKYANVSGMVASTIIINYPKDSLIPASMEQFFSELMLSDEWNHKIYSFIIENYTDIKFTKIEPIISDVREKREAIQRTRLVSFKLKIFSFYRKFARNFSRQNDIFMIATYLSSFNELMLSLRFYQIPQFWTSVSPEKEHADLSMRNWNLLGLQDDPFEKCLTSLIPKQIPTVYLEGYRKMLAQVKIMPWPKTPKIIFTSNVLWHDSVSMAYIAGQIDNGSMLVYGQHGGFGIPKFIWSEEHERKIADKYLTWGWTDENGNNIVPVGILKPLNKFRRSSTFLGKGGSLLLVRGLWAQYTHRLDSGIGLPQLLATIERCIKFVSLLPKEISKDSLIVRLYPLSTAFSSEGLKMEEKDGDFFREDLRWLQSFPWIKLSDGTRPISEYISQSRLVIYTYNGSTGYLEYMAANIPVVIFWDLDTDPVRHSALKYFESMREVGVFHETPESAAAHIEKIWSNVDAWWNDEKVQKVLNEFRGKYCNNSPDILDSIEKTFSDLLGGQGHH